MDVVDRILALMDAKGINAKTLTTEAGLSGSAITEWKRGKAKPSAEAIVKIANYFNVTADYLLGIERRDINNVNTLKEDYTMSNAIEHDIASGSGFDIDPAALAHELTLLWLSKTVNGISTEESLYNAYTAELKTFRDIIDDQTRYDPPAE